MKKVLVVLEVPCGESFAFWFNHYLIALSYYCIDFLSIGEKKKTVTVIVGFSSDYITVDFSFFLKQSLSIFEAGSMLTVHSLWDI